MGKYLTTRSAVSMLVTGAFLLTVPNFRSNVPRSNGGGQPQSPDKAAAQKAELVTSAKTKMNRRLSAPALLSRFAREHKMGSLNKQTMEKGGEREWDSVSQSEQLSWGAVPQTSNQSGPDESEGQARQANADWNKRPQDETSIAVNPLTGQWVIGANDYGIGAPIGGGVYNSEGVNYFPPFPLLVGLQGADLVTVEPPVATGDPAVAYGLTRAAPGVPAGVPVVYYASLGFGAVFNENGIFVFRSFNNGASWSRPLVPFFAPPSGLGTVVYHDQALDFSIFHDKEYIVVDNTGGPHNGRLYVTWTRFESTKQAIDMAYSDDNGRTFSDPIEISGSSSTLCPTSFGGYGDAGVCDVDQFSYPTVTPNGTLAVVFENFQSPTAAADFRGQLLVTRVDPDTFAVSGPSKVSAVIDGLNDYPFDSDGDQTLCNSNFRLGASNGNIAVDQNGKLYVTWFDDRAKAGQFPFPTFVADTPPYQCPGTSTDAGVFFSRSTDGGVTWSAAKLVSAKRAGPPRDQFQPFLASGPGGRVDVVFYDRRRDPGNKLAHTFVARSSNSGGSFKRIRVSDFASNFDDAFFGGGNFIGDYTGIVMDRFGTSYPVWTGVRPGKFDSDVFTRRVREGDDDSDNDH